MDFALTEEQQAIRETFRRLVDEKIIPRAGQIDAAAEFPREEFRAVGDLGFFGMRYPEEVGGNFDAVILAGLHALSDCRIRRAGHDDGYVRSRLCGRFHLRPPGVKCL